MLRLPIVALALVSLAARGRVVRIEVEPATVVEVPGGTFVMGISETDLLDADVACLRLHGQHRSAMSPRCQQYTEMLGEMLEREVHVGAFAIDRHEVTVAEYRDCVHAGECAIDPLIEGDERHVEDDALPVANVTWGEARAMCAWRGGRLPTEAEWEKAARGDDARRWPWGDRDRDDDWNHGQMPSEAMLAVDDLPHRNTSAIQFNPTHWADPDDRDGFAYAAPPGSFRFGDGPHGTLDQAGNVAEWVVDEWTPEGYRGLGDVDPVRGADTSADVTRVVRGGSWRDPVIFGRTALRATSNWGIRGSDRLPHVGFRCAYDR